MRYDSDKWQPLSCWSWKNKFSGTSKRWKGGSPNGNPWIYSNSKEVRLFPSMLFVSTSSKNRTSFLWKFLHFKHPKISVFSPSTSFVFHLLLHASVRSCQLLGSPTPTRTATISIAAHMSSKRITRQGRHPILILPRHSHTCVSIIKRISFTC